MTGRIITAVIVGVSLVAAGFAFLVHLGKAGIRSNFGAPPAASSTREEYPSIIFKKFDARSEAERVCGKNNITHIEEITPTESKDAGYTCSDF